ncbi:murein hydrolase B [Klebsiella variicola]|nr:murein hydrolase B [Klebsiella variicola]
MLKRRYLALLPLCVLLAACSSKPKTPAETEMASGTGGFLLEPQHNVMQMGGDFANNPAAAQFIDKMVAKHGSTDSSCRRSCRRLSAWITSCG